MEECANPLFLGWVKEWWDQAKERNTKGALAYRNAYESLRACPMRFEHPDELMVLRGFGPKTCSRLTERLVQHCEANGLPVPEKRSGAARPSGSGTATAADAASVEGRGSGSGSGATAATTTRPRKRKAYVPALRQGGYGILMALSSAEAEGREWLAKQEVIALAQPHCDASFTVRPPGKFYTAWESVKTLLNNDLVVERGRPGKRYALTEDGWAVARRLRQVAFGEDATRRGGGGGGGEGGAGRASAADGVSEGTATADLVPDGPAVDGDEAAALPDIRPAALPAGSFSVRLVLDTRERVTGQRTYMEDELAKRGARPLVRALSLGDAVWVAKCHDPGLLARLGGEGDEVVLDWVVERKREDDLVSSLRDGRFREQKFRLRRAGVPRVVYVVEAGGLDADVLLRYDEAMHSAMAATQVVDGFALQRTRSVDDTIAYLARLTHRLAARYEASPPRVVPTAALTAQNHLPLLKKLRAEAAAEAAAAATATTATTATVDLVSDASAAADVPTNPPPPSFCLSYAAFASLTSKSELLTLRDVFLKMLMCTRGITGERALEIQRVWKTPRALVEAYEQAAAHVESSGTADVAKRQRLMVSDVLGGLAGSKRRVTKPLSEKLAEAWADGRAETRV